MLVQNQVFRDHNVKQQHFVYSANFYRNGTTPHLDKYGPEGKRDPEMFIDLRITEQLDLINSQEDKMFSKNEDELFVGITGKPDFKLVVPEALTEKVYLQIIKKMFA